MGLLAGKPFPSKFDSNRPMNQGRNPHWLAGMAEILPYLPSASKPRVALASGRLKMENLGCPTPLLLSIWLNTSYNGPNPPARGIIKGDCLVSNRELEA